MKIRNTFIIFLASGFWHGANWTFIIWGFLNALYILPSVFLKTNRSNLNIVAQGRYLPTIKEFVSIAITFSLTVFAWIFFRADSVSHALSYISTIFSDSLFTMPQEAPWRLFFIILLFLLIEWSGREQTFAISGLEYSFARPVRWSIYYATIGLIFYFSGAEQQFIYFQF
jgi:D-alanyl-lipoteichoic acid acyltransferase DltB (MBOAT superfamily)